MTFFEHLQRSTASESARLIDSAIVADALSGNVTRANTFTVGSIDAQPFHVKHLDAGGVPRAEGRRRLLSPCEAVFHVKLVDAGGRVRGAPETALVM